MGNSKGYRWEDFDTLECAVCGDTVFDRMGYVSKNNSFYDSILKKPIALHPKCRKKFIKKRQKELNKELRK